MEQGQKSNDGESKRVVSKTPDLPLISPKSGPVVVSPAKEPTEKQQVVKSNPPSSVPRTLHMRQPFKILTDIWGVITPYSFRNDLLTYADIHLKEYLMAHLDEPNAELKSWLTLLEKQTREEMASHPQMPDLLPATAAAEASSPAPFSTANAREAVVDAIVANVTFRKQNNLMNGPLESINNLLWNDGYTRRVLQPPLFDDVLECFSRWAGPPLHIKIYTFASGPWEIQRLFLGASEAGDRLTRHLTCGFNAFGSFKYQAQRYRQIVLSLTERDSANLFYLTDSPNKAKQASMAGLTAFVVRREGNRKYRPELLAKCTLIDTLKQFDFYEFK